MTTRIATQALMRLSASRISPTGWPMSRSAYIAAHRPSAQTTGRPIEDRVRSAWPSIPEASSPRLAIWVMTVRHGRRTMKATASAAAMAMS